MIRNNAGGGWKGAGKFAKSTTGMITFGTIMGGAGAALTGGNFWQGAVTGLVVSGLNHAMHQTNDNETITQEQKDDPEFFSRLKARYESQKGGTLNLTKKEFDYLISKGKIDFTNQRIEKVGGTYTDYKATIDFYDSDSDLALSFGRATVTYTLTNKGVIYTGFYDEYNFDSKPWGVRTVVNEVLTRTYNVWSSGKAFNIKYH